MREHMLPIKITIPFPYDKPDKNGHIYSKDAVERAVNTLHKNIPIIYRDNSEGELKDGLQIVGHTTGDCHTVIWDSDNQVCKMIIDGEVYAGGTSCLVHDMKDGVIHSFEITGLGLSVLSKDEKIPQNKKNHIVLYADEFADDIWEQYCDICGAPSDSTEITIYFDDNDVEHNGYDELED